MKPASRETIPTVAETVHDAAAIADPERADTAVTDLFESFEDDDRPATAAEDLRGELLTSARGIDPEGDSPAVFATAAAALWLATNPGQADDPDRVLREGTRLAFAGAPPEPLAEWLTARGIST